MTKGRFKPHQRKQGNDHVSDRSTLRTSVRTTDVVKLESCNIMFLSKVGGSKVRLAVVCRENQPSMLYRYSTDIGDVEKVGVLIKNNVIEMGINDVLITATTARITWHREKNSKARTISVNLRRDEHVDVVRNSKQTLPQDRNI